LSRFLVGHGGAMPFCRGKKKKFALFFHWYIELLA